MTIYLDDDFKCYTTDGEHRRAIETDAFNGKCTEFIEAFRYIPYGETWTRYDGTVFSGEALTPWKDIGTVLKIQAAVDDVQEKADEQISELLDVIAELIIGG